MICFHWLFVPENYWYSTETMKSAIFLQDSVLPVKQTSELSLHRNILSTINMQTEHSVPANDKLPNKSKLIYNLQSSR